MNKHLYFICPTDYLETVIDNTFKQEKYYCTSLGNSITFDKDMMWRLNEILEEKEISEISFILSDDNRIVLDALGKQGFSEIIGLNNFYNQIIRQKKNSEVSWQTRNRQFLILSYHLHNKIKELRFGLKNLFFDQFKINGQIYNKEKRIFNHIYTELICEESFSLN